MLERWIVKHWIALSTGCLLMAAAVRMAYAQRGYAAIGGECGICGWIRTNKDKRQDREWQKEDLKESQERYEQEMPDISDGSTSEEEQEEN